MVGSAINFNVHARRMSPILDRMNEKEMEPPIINSARGRARLLSISRLLPTISGTGTARMENNMPATAEIITGFPRMVRINLLQVSGMA